MICGFSDLMNAPDYSFEAALQARGLLRIAGVDEVGRGPLAGPVTAAVVVLDPARLPVGLNDSKVLSAGRRKELLVQIMETAEVSIGHASVEEIDDINILRASHLAMERAIAGLSQPPDHVLVDGNLIPRGLTLPRRLSSKVTRSACRSQPLRSWRKSPATQSCGIWRNSSPVMAGRQMQDTHQKVTG